MPEYLAKYTVSAYMYDGAWMPDPEEHKPEHRFTAKDEVEARGIAEKHRETFREIYFNPTSRLDELLKVDDVQI